ncbi:MAG: hypothetical protein KAG97_06715, partial [Victivallales bacterium]|nr:hypothetical protein [Victivallales bacterium]
MRRMIKGVGALLIATLSFAMDGLGGETAEEVSQYGITWTFDREVPVGQFVNGDWWVVGPVKVIRVTPEPGPSASKESGRQKSRYGAVALRADDRMRNGSMIIEGPEYSSKDQTGFGQQGYDSRVINYDEDRSVRFPCKLKVNRSLISTISSETYRHGKLKTPDLLGENKIFMNRKESPLALHTAAILTCLETAPPEDAFRPPYAGTKKPIYRAGEIRWDLLPDVSELKSTPDWEIMARLFERPWLDHTSSWTIQYTLPGQNGPHYGREFARLSSLAALMLLQDVSERKKTPLMIGYLQ